MDTLLDITRELRIPRSEVLLRTSRSSGPGGQHANVTASRVEAVFDAAGSPSLTAEQRARILARLGPQVSAVAQEHRSQARNRELALERLCARLADALRVPRTRRPTRPTRTSAERRLRAKRERAQLKRTRRVDPSE